jgi:NAD(P)-dependent dehydrogenase (short-subunit alcohol dehydrogenase family)
MNKMLENRVAVVTGSGRGLGRAYAMAIAKEGAKVVINDLGCDPMGIGSSPIPADQVTDEIKNSGGIAIANYDSVCTAEGADRIIDTAIENFGRIDILVNNAGIIRDNLVYDMSDEDFDLVMRTHLYGTFYCIRAASRIMKEQHYGRIVNISSLAGYGDVTGELNYAAAKDANAVVTRTISRDLVNFGVTCNAISPGANTRLGPASDEQRKRIGLQALIVKEGETADNTFEKYGEPEDVAPLVVYLVSEQASNVSGCLFEVHANYMALFDEPPPQKVQSLMTEEERFTPQELAEILPMTLTKNVKLPVPTMFLQAGGPRPKFVDGAKGWLWANKGLNEVAPS